MTSKVSLSISMRGVSERPANTRRSLLTLLADIIASKANVMGSLFGAASQCIYARGAKGTRTAQWLVYRIDLGSDGSVSATIVTTYSPVSWILSAVVRPTTPACGQILGLWRAQGEGRTGAENDDLLLLQPLRCGARHATHCDS
jgi:hypothetical protein